MVYKMHVHGHVLCAKVISELKSLSGLKFLDLRLFPETAPNICFWLL